MKLPRRYCYRRTQWRAEPKIMTADGNTKKQLKTIGAHISSDLRVPREYANDY